jgi:hypothetical protein
MLSKSTQDEKLAPGFEPLCKKTLEFARPIIK